VIEIDGSLGEGGGQVLRSALTLSLLSQQAFRITNIRAHRKKAGLRAQHLASVLAAKDVGKAQVSGAELGSQELVFSPAGLFGGHYHIEIGTAGSCSLVLQTIFLPLALAGGESKVELSGGTHVPWSPTYDYIDKVWLPIMRELGYPGEIVIKKAGFYPKGGGKIVFTVAPARDRRGLNIRNPSVVQSFAGLSMIANLPGHVAARQHARMLQRLGEQNSEVEIEIQNMSSPGKGSSVFISTNQPPPFFGFSALGEKGKPAEVVADEAVDHLMAFLKTNADVDRFLADQLLIPLSILNERSNFYVERVTRHLLTNAEVIRKFLPVGISVGKPEKGIRAKVTVIPEGI
jgi:RNA 3'-terminal phosphate cyclase (ATP)